MECVNYARTVKRLEDPKLCPESCKWEVALLVPVPRRVLRVSGFTVLLGQYTYRVSHSITQPLRQPISNHAVVQYTYRVNHSISQPLRQPISRLQRSALVLRVHTSLAHSSS